MDMKKTLTSEQKALFDALTQLQRRFVTALLNGKNQTEAYRKAGGKAKTDDTARAQASRMITFDNVQAFLQSVQYEAINDAIMTHTEAMERLTTMGRATIRDLAEFSEHELGKDEHGKPIIQAVWRFKDSVKQNPEMLDAIAELTAGREGIKLKLHDSKAAIKQLAEMQGWEAPRKSEHTIKGLPTLTDLFGGEK
ncbi:terminase small subunit [Yersinia pekkanenii]|uniref:Phage terminase small subunit n=1 Tax=Yersinia pekkanenii TaxID=1288385 RepID=A0A0T9RB89_9GAMM|nr:terminase small subunit [Yersinia pekkanenii]CNI54068.1 phage terminase small subunit [Yersinia pekkanenii]CRY69357.1 phage terminase small subunit [Yersinia pekkanenii]